MNKLNIIFTNYDSAYWHLSRYLYSNRDILLNSGIQYQYNYSPFWQTNNLNEAGCLINSCNLKNGKEQDRIDSIMGALAGQYMEGRDLLWLLPMPKLPAIDLLFTKISCFFTGKNLKPHVVMLPGRQDDSLRCIFYHCWKNWPTIEEVTDSILKLDIKQLDQIYERLRERAGEDSCFVMPHNSASIHNVDNSILAQLGKLLDFPKIENSANSEFPVSLPGLEIAHAVYNFPFTNRDKLLWDRNEFYNKLRQVEQRERLAEVNFVPAKDAGVLLRASEAGNQRLAGMTGGKSLFANPHPLDNLPDLPESLPELTEEQCFPFIAAWPGDFKNDLLRYFRDWDIEYSYNRKTRRPLNSSEKTLMAALEKYRVKYTTSLFSCPRPAPEVTVLTMCYNQENYIEKCLESVAEQKLDRPMEHILVDDCSNDKTASIIDDFASRHSHVRPVYLPCHCGGGLNVRTLFSMCRSKYASLCDGDDYFINPDKLQSQVDLLDANPDYGLCFHPVLVTYEDMEYDNGVYPPVDMLPRGLRKFYYLPDMFQANLIQTNSVMYRWRFRDGLPDWFRPDLCPGDWYWHLLHAERGKIGFSRNVMSVYRRHKKGYYYTSCVSEIDHRKKHGMSELETYHVINQHFKGRYFVKIANLANAVFANFLSIELKEGDDHYLEDACNAYPDFGRHFLKDVKIAHFKRPKSIS